MPTAAQKDDIEGAIADLQQVQAALLDAILASTDTVELLRLKAVNDYVANLMGQLVHTRLVEDEALFAQVMGPIKQTASHLQDQTDKIKNISSAIGDGAKVVGYLGGAATFVATV